MWQLMAKHCNSCGETSSNVGSKCSSDSHSICEIVKSVAHHHHPRDRTQCVWWGMNVAMCMGMAMMLVLVFSVIQHKYN